MIVKCNICGKIRENGKFKTPKSQLLNQKVSVVYCPKCIKNVVIQKRTKYCIKCNEDISKVVNE